MYSVQVKTEVHFVNASFWDMNQITYSSLYRTLEYLKDSQVRLGDIPLFFEIYERNQPVALFPIVLFMKKSNYPPVDPHLIINKALNICLADEEPVAMCVTFFGLGCPVIVDGKVDWEEILTKIKDVLYQEYKISYLAICYQSQYDDPFINYTFNNLHVTQTPHKEFGLLDLRKFTTYEDYLAVLSQKSRQSFRAENRLALRNNLNILRKSVEPEDTELLGRLAAEVYRKYGNEVDPVRLKTFAENTAASYPNDMGVFAAYKDSNLIAYAMYIQHNNVLHMKMLGRNYELDRYQSYFMVTYHAPIQYAFKAGIDFIDYGGGSADTKKRRGIEMLRSYSYVI